MEFVAREVKVGTKDGRYLQGVVLAVDHEGNVLVTEARERAAPSRGGAVTPHAMGAAANNGSVRDPSGVSALETAQKSSATLQYGAPGTRSVGLVCIPKHEIVSVVMV